MLRTVLRFGFSQALGLFFRRIEVSGAALVPRSGPTLFAINHPNGLIDPLMLLCFAPRPVSFLGKAPLISMPVIGFFARALDTIPVYRQQDQANTTGNRKTFLTARALLDRGGTIAIAPEGASHSDPDFRKFKTGAARIALGAGTTEPVAIVPVGLFYTAKATFRSSALVVFGPPLFVQPVTLGPANEPPADAVRAVTAALLTRMAALVVRADEVEAIAVATKAEGILTAALPDPKTRSLDDIRTVRQRLANGYHVLREREPELLARLVRRMDRLDRAFRLANLDPAHPTPPAPGLSGIVRAVGWLIFRVLVFLPLALPGLVLHLPAYWTIGFLARRLSKGQDDVVATMKVAGAGILYPATWIAAGVAAGRWFGWPTGVAAGLLAAPLSGYAALRLVERFGRFVSGTRALGLSLFERDHFGRLIREREAFRADLITLEQSLASATTALPIKT